MVVSKYNGAKTRTNQVMVIPSKYSVNAVVGKIKGMISSALKKKLGG